MLDSLGGASGGLTRYMDDGLLCYEYNVMIVERYTVKSKDRIAAGKYTIVFEIDTLDPRLRRPCTCVFGNGTPTVELRNATSHIDRGN